jgi:hypothetical protein
MRRRAPLKGVIARERSDRGNLIHEGSTDFEIATKACCLLAMTMFMRKSDLRTA